MDTAESVQEATLPADSGVGAGESLGVSAAEPVAAEPVAQASSEPTESIKEVNSFPEIESFDWESWDGSDYEAFPENIKPWADKLKGYHTKSLDSLTKTHGTELDYWKRMYEALQYGDEDPRIEEFSSKMEQLEQEKAEMQEQYKSLQTSVNEEREQENDRYFKWFERNYEGKLEKLATDHGADIAETMVLSLMDMGMDVHVAVEVSLMGTEAVKTATSLSDKVTDTNLVLEILKSRYSTTGSNDLAETGKAKETVKAPNPATQVVAGSAPVSRPAQLAKEKSPTYGSSNQRMASLMSAAENAIRKSKRR